MYFLPKKAAEPSTPLREAGTRRSRNRLSFYPTLKMENGIRPMADAKFAAFVHDHLHMFGDEICRLATQPSVSARNEGVAECADLVVEMMERLGISTRVLRIKGAAPLVFGELKASNSSKTILFYNHYDVQPEQPVEEWRSKPFTPLVKEGRLYGRGVSDDKGELVSRLKLLEAYLSTAGEAPCTFKFCFEGEEEIGSPHLDEYVSQSPKLFQSDALFWEWGGVDELDRPVVQLGVKGMIYLELVVKELASDAHSKNAAALPSAPWKLVRVLEAIKDAHEKILVPGWYDRVEKLDEGELKILDDEPFDAEGYKKTFGASEFAGGMSASRAKKSLAFGPTANIAGIWSGYTGEGTKTVLPREARCKMDLRLVPNQDPEQLLWKFKQHLIDKGFKSVEVIAHQMVPPARTSSKSVLAQAAARAGEVVYGKKSVVRLSSAGVGPLYVFKRRYGMPSVSIGVSAPDSQIHAPNENLRLDLLEKGILWLAETIDSFSRTTKE